MNVEEYIYRIETIRQSNSTYRVQGQLQGLELSSCFNGEYYDSTMVLSLQPASDAHCR